MQHFCHIFPIYVTFMSTRGIDINVTYLTVWAHFCQLPKLTWMSHIHVFDAFISGFPKRQQWRLFHVFITFVSNRKYPPCKGKRTSQRSATAALAVRFPPACSQLTAGKSPEKKCNGSSARLWIKGRARERTGLWSSKFGLKFKKWIRSGFKMNQFSVPQSVLTWIHFGSPDEFIFGPQMRSFRVPKWVHFGTPKTTRKWSLLATSQFRPYRGG